MTANQYLTQLRTVDAEIESLIDEKAALESKLVRGTQSITGMPRGGSHDSQNAIIAVAEAAARIDEKIAELCRLKAEAHAVIDMVDRGDLRQVLQLRYVNCLSWSRVARRMHYDERQVYRLYKLALRAVEEILGNRGS